MADKVLDALTLRDTKSGTTTEYKIQDSILKARVDALTKLGEGSTTGDAELQDIRVDYKGTTHENAGDAVRASDQALNDKIDDEVSKLKEDLSNIGVTNYIQYIKESNAISNKYYAFYDGKIIVGEHSDYAIYEPFEVPKGKYYGYGLYHGFTIIEDKVTGVFTKLSDTNETYIERYTGEELTRIFEIVLEHDSIIYATTSPVLINRQRVQFSNSGNLLTSFTDRQTDYYAEGVYGRWFNGELTNHNIITVGKDNKRKFNSIKSAVESISDSSKDNVYDIYIDDGTYEEYAITLPDYVNLIGASGNREKCIIKGELPDTASASEIEQNSTINLMYSNRLENLTITAKNLRYPIHSESGGLQTDWTQILNNCYVEHFGNTSPNSTWTSCHAWGEGASSGAYAEFNNCVFKGTVEAWYVHEPVNMPSNPKPYHHVLNNCDIINTSVSTTPYWIISAKIDNTTDKGVISTVDFNDCNFGNGCISVSGAYDINVNIHGHNNVAITRGKTSNYPNTDFTTVKTYVGTESITKDTVLMYADGINLVKKANSNTPSYMIAGVSTEDCEPNSLVKIIKGTYVSKTGSVGSKVYCDDNGQFSDSGTVEIGVCYGQFSLIN